MSDTAASIDAAIPSRAIYLLSLAAFASGTNLRICDQLLPQIADEFHVTTGGASIVVSVFAMAYAVLQAFFGPLGDRYGKYRIICYATLGSSLGVLACALAPTLNMLTAARLLTAIGGAAIIPLSMAWIGDVVAYEARQSALARFLTGQISGLILGQSIGGIISDHYGWRAAFLVIVILHLVAGAGLALEMRRNPLTRLAGASGPSGVSPLAIARGLAALWALPWVRIVLVSVMIEGMLVYGALTFVGAHLKTKFGLGYGFIGALLALYGGGGLLYALASNRLVAWLGETGLVAWGAAIASLAFVMLALAPYPWVSALGIFLLGLGFYMMHNTLQTNATQMAPEKRGAAVAFFAQVFFLGQAIGVAANGALVDHFGAAPGFWLAAAGLPLLGLWLAARIRARTAH